LKSYSPVPPGEARDNSPKHPICIRDGKQMNMLVMTPESPPFRQDAGGAIRVGASRVGLEIVIERFEEGMSAEEILKAYDTLKLADIYATLAYYLRHKEEVNAYLKQLQAETQALRDNSEVEVPPITRQMLISRLQARKEGHASPGQ
jgi:uncharacterized protein (DUF433 family)